MKAAMRIRAGVVAMALVSAWPAGGASAQSDGERYELRGKVVNAVTGAVVPNALVQLANPETAVSETPPVQFSGPDGTFTFAGLPRGDYQLLVNKPGFFNEQELGRTYATDTVHKVPTDGDVELKLTAEGIMYGRVEDENGQPMEGLAVRLKMWAVINGVKRLENTAAATTDDEGQFRLAELRPGTYYLNFTPGSQGWRAFNGLIRKNPNEQGYGSQFYPGVPDVSSATAIRIRGGSQVQITQTLKPQRVYELAGAVRGAAGRVFQINLVEPSGEPVQKNFHIDPKTGQFQIEEVPEGKYVLMAAAPDTGGTGQGGKRQLTAYLPIQVNRDVTGLALQLGRGATVDVKIEDEIPAQGEEMHQVQINLTAKEYPPMSQGLTVPPPKGDLRSPRRFENLAPGSYQVEARTFGFGYVASLRSGDVDLLKDELMIGADAAAPPIQVVLRPDGAELEVQATENGKPVAATVVVYSEEYPKSSLMQTAAAAGKTSWTQQRPGVYKVAAFRGWQEVEFQEESFAEKYLAQAKEVNLKPGDKVELTVEVQSGEEE